MGSSLYRGYTTLMDTYTILDNEDWSIRCEYDENWPTIAVIHCDVHNQNPSKMKEYLHTWDEIVEQMIGKGITSLAALVTDESSEMFAVMFGFSIRESVDVVGAKGTLMEMRIA